MSFPDIGKKYNMNYQTVYSIFKSLKIQVRTTSESIFNSIKNGKNTQDNFNSYPYKSGYHINWKGENEKKREEKWVFHQGAALGY